MQDTASAIGPDPGHITQDTLPAVSALTLKDLTEALHAGYADLAASRSDVILIALVYPVLGLILLTTGLSMNLLPLLFPMIAGFAMLGPVAAIGLYEISRLREAGENPDWVDAFGVLRAPVFFRL